MCEIAIIDPARTELGYLYQLCTEMYDRNDDGLGLVGVYRNGDGFEYRYYKAERPSWSRVGQFIAKRYEDEAWRIVVHARLATVGGIGDAQAHPIVTTCPKCDVRMVVHNGWVAGQERRRKHKKKAGHDFSTTVDTEVIAHKHRTLPESVDDLSDPGLFGQLAYVLFGDDRILVRSNRFYQHTDDLRMGKRLRDIADGGTGTPEWVLATPEGVETRQVQRRGGLTVIGGGGYGQRTTTRGSRTTRQNQESNAVSTINGTKYVRSSGKWYRVKVTDGKTKRLIRVTGNDLPKELRHTEDDHPYSWVSYL